MCLVTLPGHHCCHWNFFWACAPLSRRHANISCSHLPSWRSLYFPHTCNPFFTETLIYGTPSVSFESVCSQRTLNLCDLPPLFSPLRSGSDTRALRTTHPENSNLSIFSVIASAVGDLHISCRDLELIRDVRKPETFCKGHIQQFSCIHWGKLDHFQFFISKNVPEITNTVIRTENWALLHLL